MKETFLLLSVACFVILAGCETRQPQQPRIEVRTIETEPPVPAAAPEALDPFGEERATATEIEESESGGTEPGEVPLPFAPPISMDPVDGGKVTITSETPWAEHKGRIYYFTSQANRQAFMANPQEFLKGRFATY